MTALTIVNNVQDQLGLTRSTVVAASTDPQVRQLLSLLNVEGKVLAKRWNWQALKQESTFTTVAAESQGAITTLAGADFDRFINDSMWNRTQRRPVFGPVTDTDWAMAKAATSTSPFSSFRMRGNAIRFNPVPAAGDTVAFEWMSKNAFQATGGGATKVAVTVDTDVGILDEMLYELGLKWRWRKAQGLDYAEDFDEYEKAVANAKMRDGGKTSVNLGAERRLGTGITVPDGSWNVS